MLNKFKSILGFGNNKKTAITLKKNVEIKDAHDFDQTLLDEFVYHYPPFPKPLPSVNIERILDTNQDLIRQIILACGLAGKHNVDEVELKIMSPIRHLAGITHLLPATEKEYFRAAGGLFRFCLESSLLCIRAAERKILTRVTPELRKDNETLWAHASFLTGLFSEAIIVIARVTVYSDDGGIEWNPGTDTLTEWLVENRLKSYHIKWGKTENPAIISFIAGKVIQREQSVILAEGEKNILMTLIKALNEPKNRQNSLASINLDVRTSLIRRDNASDATRYGRPLSGMHLSPWLIDAMRHLLKKRRWVVNEENGRVWYGEDGVYIVWPLGAEDIKHELRESKCRFVPSTMGILAELMDEAGIIEKVSELRGHLFEIAVLQSDSPEKKFLTAVRLSRKEVLFESAVYKPLEMNLQVFFEGENENESDLNTIEQIIDNDSIAEIREIVEEANSGNQKNKNEPKVNNHVNNEIVNQPILSSDDDDISEEISIDMLFGNRILNKSTPVDTSKTNLVKEGNDLNVLTNSIAENIETITYDNEYEMDYQEASINYDDFPLEFYQEVDTKSVVLDEIVRAVETEVSIKIIEQYPISEIELDVQVNKVVSAVKKEWRLPSLSLLDSRESRIHGYTETELNELSSLVEAILKNFNLDVRVVDRHPGPVITLFELELAAGVKVSRVSTLDKDLARGLSVTSVRIVEVIPGKSVIGLEIPNKERSKVWLRELLSSDDFENSESYLTLAIGQDIYGAPLIADLGKMPHALVAGTTGSGKSVAINTMILSMLFRATPDQVQLIMIDPKMLELSVYEGIPHLLIPVVTDMTKAGKALHLAIDEMERRYKLLAQLGAKNLDGFNHMIRTATANGEFIQNPLLVDAQEEPNAESPSLAELPLIVIIIDELADMLMIDKKVEGLIVRLAQKARAAGIHLILATQRPSSDILTGTIKANVPARFALQVLSRIDSRTILDQGGAESLLGNGDMLYMSPGSTIPIRAHGAFIDDQEIHRVVDFLKYPDKPCYQDLDGQAATPLETISAPVAGMNETVITIDDSCDDFEDATIEFEEPIKEAAKEIAITSEQKIDVDLKESELPLQDIAKDKEEHESTEDMLNELFGASRKPKPNVILPKTEVNNDDNEVYQLFGNQKTAIKSSESDLKLRKDMLLKRLRKIPKEHLSSQASGITKVMVKGIKNSKLDLRDCIAVLKSSDLLILVDGLETGCDESGNKLEQYFLIKSDLLNG